MDTLGVSAHDHGDCELCDQLDRERGALQARVKALEAALQDTLVFIEGGLYLEASQCADAALAGGGR